MLASSSSLGEAIPCKAFLASVRRQILDHFTGVVPTLFSLLFRPQFGLRFSNWSFERPGLGVAAGELICTIVTPVPPETVSKSLGKGRESSVASEFGPWHFRWWMGIASSWGDASSWGASLALLCAEGVGWSDCTVLPHLISMLSPPRSPLGCKTCLTSL